MFDVLVDELRTRSSEWLRRERERLVVEQRNLRTRELAVLRRIPGCARRRGLEVHHLVPRSSGGSDDISNLAAVCPAHHRLLVPHGLLALVGNPNLSDGLELVTASRGPPLVPV